MALYLGKDKIAGHSIDSKIGDTLPVGAIIDYDGTEVPANWELVDDNEQGGAGVVIISSEDGAEENYDKLLSAVEYLEDEYQIHLTKNIIFEDVTYNSDWNGMPIYAFPVTAEGTSSEWWISFHGEDDQHIYDYVVHAALVDGIKQFDYTTNVKLGTPINHLNSTSEDEILSANQGRVLNEKIEQCKIIDVTELPEITDENKNQIIRYNGDLYAVANTAVDIPLAQGMQIGGKKLIFNWPFQITQYPTTIDTYITVFSTTGDIVENFNLNAYHLYGNTTVDAHTITFGDVYINDLAVSQDSNIIAYYGNFSSQYEKHTFQYGATSLQIPDGDITIDGFNTTEASELLNCFKIREYQLAWNKISESEAPKAIRYFYLDNSDNQASYVKIPYEEGMNWAEFIASDYNRNEFFHIDGGGTIRTNNNYILTNIGGYSYEGSEFQEIRPETYIMAQGGAAEPT